jgi:RNA polymerase sigma-70 factor, ECF subfamily
MELIKKARTKVLQFYLQLLETEEELQKFTQLYETYRKLMHWTAEKILHDEHLAEDAVHEAFLRIIQNFHQIREIPCPKTRSFVVIIVRNVALNMQKKRKREEKETFREILPEESTDFREDALRHAIDNISYGFDETIDEIYRNEIMAAVLSMPDVSKEILLLYGYVGYSVRDIAKYLKITEATAYKRLHRARNALAKKIGRRWENDGNAASRNSMRCDD